MPTPNGILTLGNLCVRKADRSRGWNCETRGTVGWGEGVHEWRVVLPDGGRGVRLGISEANIDLTNNDANKLLRFAMHCDHCTIFDRRATGNRKGLNNVVVVPQGATVSVRLDMNARTLSFALNGVWNAPCVENLGAGPFFPYFGLYEGSRARVVAFE